MPNGNVMPPALDFVVLDKQGNNLLTGITTPVEVSSVNASGQSFSLGRECSDGGCTMIRASYSYGLGTPKYNFHYSTLGAPLASSAGSKTWYITIGGKTDTLHYDVQKTRPDDPLFKYDTKAVVFNGQVALQEDPGQPPLYVFRRKR
jgi:hypothetical protein